MTPLFAIQYIWSMILNKISENQPCIETLKVTEQAFYSLILGKTSCSPAVQDNFYATYAGKATTYYHVSAYKSVTHMLNQYRKKCSAPFILYCHDLSF